MAINILVSGLTPMLGIAWFQQGGQTPLLQQGERFDADHPALRGCHRASRARSSARSTAK